METGDLGERTLSQWAATTKYQLTVAMKGCGSRAVISEFLYKNVQFLNCYVGPIKYFFDHTPTILQLLLYIYIVVTVKEFRVGQTLSAKKRRKGDLLIDIVI